MMVQRCHLENPSALTVFAFAGGALAIGLGFGMQNLLKNFVSGLILLFERPIHVGDIKGGGACSDALFARRKAQFDTGAADYDATVSFWHHVILPI